MRSLAKRDHLRSQIKRIHIDKGAQVFLQYVIVVGIIVVALIVMTPYMKRSIQGVIKMAADQIGTQENAEQQIDVNRGYLEETNIGTQVRSSKTTEDRQGTITYTYDDRTDTSTNAAINLGFQESPL